MAKFDITQIPNYETLSADELRKAIAEVEIPDDNSAKLVDENGRLKTALNKVSSEVADYKKKLKEKETAEETAKREREEADKKRDEELAGLHRKLDIQKYEQHYLSMGYKPELAKETAEAQANGDLAKVMANQQKFMEQFKAEQQEQSIKNQPSLNGGDPQTTPMTKAQIMAIKDAHERQKAISEHLELFD